MRLCLLFLMSIGANAFANEVCETVGKAEAIINWEREGESCSVKASIPIVETRSSGCSIAIPYYPCFSKDDHAVDAVGIFNVDPDNGGDRLIFVASGMEKSTLSMIEVIAKAPNPNLESAKGLFSNATLTIGNSSREKIDFTVVSAEKGSSLADKGSHKTRTLFLDKKH